MNFYVMVQAGYNADGKQIIKCYYPSSIQELISAVMHIQEVEEHILSIRETKEVREIDNYPVIRFKKNESPKLIKKTEIADNYGGY